MKRAPHIALIINTSNQADYLARVLGAVARQTVKPAEVILADDGSEEETRTLFAAWSKHQNFRAAHVWQKKEGFRRARILNKAVSEARAEYLVFLDGDTLPHPEFISDHSRLAKPGSFVQGHRALIEQRAAEWFGKGPFEVDRRRGLFARQITGWKHCFRWPMPLDRQRVDLHGVRGCNLGIWRDDLQRVNGYNEAFEGWGREDSELAARLLNSGVRRRDVRGWALCYHLWHPPASRAQLASNDDLLASAIREGRKICERGLNLHEPA
ncbi:MAG TPA: glycosyltransferase family 2 protein [Verrucomicrobiae bacterium]|jgi:glycosyltransferase involved in cell wall biosynthesis